MSVYWRLEVYKTGSSANADEDVETRFTYDGSGNIVTLTAVNPTTGNQVICYLYEDAVTISNFTEARNFDKTGNWLQYNKDGTIENRTHNAANELQGIATHDANGTMALMPGFKGKYDAWNRLVEVQDLTN